jgi:hypothetical protein
MFIIKEYLSDRIVVSRDQLYLIFSDRRNFPRRRINPYKKEITFDDVPTFKTPF